MRKREKVGEKRLTKWGKREVEYSRRRGTIENAEKSWVVYGGIFIWYRSSKSVRHYLEGDKKAFKGAGQLKLR